MKARSLAVTVLLLLLLACQRQGDAKVVELTGRIFVFNYRVATATYLITLQKLAPLPDGSIVTAEFENPQGGPALQLREAIFAVDDRITLESPKLQCVRKDHAYAVRIEIRDGSGHLLQEVTTSVTSDQDQSVLPSRPLVVGPGYSPNPEVFHADGSTDFSGRTDCPG